MDWFRQNPFVSGLIAAVVVLGGAGLYFVSTESAALAEQTELYAGHTGSLSRLESSKPFPNEANNAAAKADLEAAEATLNKLSTAVESQSEPVKPVTPEQFQDELSKKVAALTAAATAAGVQLPDDFYLGFNEYRAQPPSPDAAPLLGQQLLAVERAVNILIKSGIKSLGAITRPKLTAEAPAPPKKDAGAPAAAGPQGGIIDLSLAPFDVSFVSDQAAFRSVMSGLTTSKPIIFIRLLSVANESPNAPTKGGGENATPAPAAGTPEGETGIPVIFGQEMLNVTMRLAAVSGPREAAK